MEPVGVDQFTQSKVTSSTSPIVFNGPVRKGEPVAIASFLNKPITVLAAALLQSPTLPIEAARPSRMRVSVNLIDVY